MQKEKNELSRDLVSVFVFLLITVCSMLYIQNINEYFFLFILLGLAFFTVSSIIGIIRALPIIKQKYYTRNKLNLSKSFKWNYFIFLNGLFLLFGGLICAMLINTILILAVPFGAWFSYSCSMDIMQYNKEDIEKIDTWKNRMVKKLASKIDY